MLSLVIGTFVLTVALLILPSKAVESYKAAQQMQNSEINKTVAE
jgi:hypothetical protein